MKLKMFTIIGLLCIAIAVSAQVDQTINQTDKSGKKQGHWIKKDGNIKIYDGFFKDDHPVGEFRRYNNDNTLKSLLVYSADGKVAEATIYHPNGFIASKGKYINQQKEGKWKFYSEYTEGYLISEEEYSKNLKNGTSIKYYPDEKVAERMNFINDIRNGEWTQYYQNGVLSLKTNYLNGKINGRFEAWFENGNKELTGEYINNIREGHWLIYKEDGTIKYELDYVAGVTNNRQMEIDESNFLDALEKNTGNIPDPEKTGKTW